MTPNPFAGLLHSRKFWLLILDTVVSFAGYFVTKYAAPEAANDVLYVIGGIQPIFIALIAGIVSEDNAERKAQAEIETAQLYRLGDKDATG